MPLIHPISKQILIKIKDSMPVTINNLVLIIYIAYKIGIF